MVALHHIMERLGSISALQEEQKQIEQEVKLFMGDNESASSECYRVSWGNVDDSKFKVQEPVHGINIQIPNMHHEDLVEVHIDFYLIGRLEDILFFSLEHGILEELQLDVQICEQRMLPCVMGERGFHKA